MSSGDRLQGEALEQALKEQIEYYFSRQNLASDAFLISQMNSERYVPVNVIAGFKRVSQLTQNKELLLKVMRKCKNLEFNEAMDSVRPNLKIERKTLVIREIDSKTPVEEIENIFKQGKILPSSIRSEIGDNWFCTFKSEDECMAAAENLISKKFKGQPIRFRVKSETLVRGFHFYGTGPQEIGASSNRYGTDDGSYRGPDDFAYYNQYMYPGNIAYNPTMAGIQGPQGRGAPSGGRKVKGKKKKQAVRKRKGDEPEPKLGPEDFPELPGSSKATSHVGYSGSFVSYTREELARIVEALPAKDMEKPPFDTTNNPILAETPDKRCQLFDPIPVFYPASPSPELAAQPIHSSQLAAMPFLDLDMGGSAVDVGLWNQPAPATTGASPAKKATAEKSSKGSNRRSSKDDRKDAQKKGSKKSAPSPAAKQHKPAREAKASQAKEAAKEAKSTNKKEQSKKAKKQSQGKPEVAETKSVEAKEPAPLVQARGAWGSNNAASVVAAAEKKAAEREKEAATAPRPVVKAAPKAAAATPSSAPKANSAKNNGREKRERGKGDGEKKRREGRQRDGGKNDKRKQGPRDEKRGGKGKKEVEKAPAKEKESSVAVPEPQPTKSSGPSWADLIKKGSA